MRKLTKNEVAFVKETGFTPTVYQCREYHRTAFYDMKLDKKDYDPSEGYHYQLAKKVAREKYNVDLDEFLKKNISQSLNDGDSISLEYVATYLFYLFFTKEELQRMTDEAATEFLKNYRYYYGFRKWDGGNLTYVNDAIRAYEGEIEFYEDTDGNVLWREVL